MTWSRGSWHREHGVHLNTERDGINPLIEVKLELMKFRSMSVMNTSPESSRGEGEGRERWSKT